ncbi:MAG TPA: hypothetical protein VHF58_09975 [Solirubrobacterales bacterium]|nr:hypothetical protein [Solirubrobacterales bacterium]
MLPLAHAGHWLVYVLYAVPVVIVLGSIALTMVRDRRARRAADERGGEASG